jgi:hypothetical protein
MTRQEMWGRRLGCQRSLRGKQHPELHDRLYYPRPLCSFNLPRSVAPQAGMRLKMGEWISVLLCDKHRLQKPRQDKDYKFLEVRRRN